MVRRSILLLSILSLSGAFWGTAHADLIGNWVLYPDPVLEAGPSGSWDADSVYGPEVVHDGSQYRMWYTGRGAQNDKYQIGYATSEDGITWAKHPSNPVLTVGDPGSWDEERVWAPAVLFDGSIWKMWYTGYSSVTGSQIGYAMSQDGIVWTKYEHNPVLTTGPSGAWDENHVLSPHVMLKQGTYHMWYSNMDTGSDFGRIGYATSADGFHWTKYSDNPVLEPPPGTPWSSPLGVVSPTVINLFGVYHMWYEEGWVTKAGYEWLILHGVSSDGISWAQGGSPFPHAGGDRYYYPSVVSHGGFVKMWYVSCGKIFYAEAAIASYRVYCPIIVR